MTPTTKTWRFEAHQVREIPAEPDQVVAALEMAPLLQVESVHHGRVRVRTGGMVGAMVRGTLRVEVRPRHMSRAVTLGLVLGSGGLDAHILPADHAPDDDLLRLVALAFLGAVGRLFQRGLRRDYREAIVRTDPLRGEVDLERWHGPRSPDGGMHPWCRVRERTADLPEHRMLHAALRRLSRSVVLDVAPRQRAAALAARLDDVPCEAPPRSGWPHLRREGLFAPYAAPLGLAEVVLEGLLSENLEGEADGRGFLLDLDRLFERWLAAELSRLAPEGWRVVAQETASICSPTLHRHLDVAVHDPTGSLVAILDAKNKSFEGGIPARDDVHQIVTYMATQKCRLGVLVGVQPGDELPPQEYRLRGDMGRLQIVGLPGLGEMEEMVAAAANWCRTYLGWGWARKEALEVRSLAG
jgi:hypothetical protein